MEKESTILFKKFSWEALKVDSVPFISFIMESTCGTFHSRVCTFVICPIFYKKSINYDNWNIDLSHGKGSIYIYFQTRFAKPVIPGQRLVVDMWKEGTRVFFTCTVKETGKACLTGTYIIYTYTWNAKGNKRLSQKSNSRYVHLCLFKSQYTINFKPTSF